MWHKLGLRGRIYIILSVLMLITLIGGVVMIRYTYRMETLLTLVIDRDIGAFETAEALETAMVNQKSIASYYFLDRDPDWLRQLGEYRQLFREHLSRASFMSDSREQRDALRQIEAEYNDYVRIEDLAYKQWDSLLYRKSGDHFFKLLALFENYKNIHRQRISDVSRESRREARYLRIIMIMAISMSFFLIFFLAIIFIHTHSELEKSREHLQQTEKMAMVGKLAASMAHSIRNPFTSVKMRLFSLSRSLKMSEAQQEDFEVISQEIRHVDTIVQNFLEFSRPPRLKMQAISPSAVVDMTIQLLEHRLKSYEVSVRFVRKENMPEIMADPEQLKEVIVNLMINACEAMGNKGGRIIILEETVPDRSAVVIDIRDNGPGIPKAVREKIFQPFFTTKEEGTGLGLSIAARIIEEHGGKLSADSKEGHGATFRLTLPARI
ncbi:MAG TPA: histidine kinase [Desulfobacteraceae bacterium]|nr:histidine kinase [Desulfobacteraceae bacterium]